MEQFAQHFPGSNKLRLPKQSDFVGHFDPKVQRHLRDVFSTLCGCLLMATVGVYAQIKFGFLSPVISSLGLFGLMMWLYSMPATKENENQRKMLLAGCTFLKGAILSPLIEVNLHQDPGLLITALACTCAIFFSFTMAAILAPRRKYFYLGGFLGSMSMMLMIMSLASMWSHSVALFRAQLYLGLLVFSAHVVLDVQVIVESAHSGCADVITDSLSLFMDFVGILVRIIIILMDRSNENNNRRRKRRD